MKTILLTLTIVLALTQVQGQMHIDSLCENRIRVRLLGASPIQSVEVWKDSSFVPLTDQAGWLLVVENMQGLEAILWVYGYEHSGTRVYAIYTDYRDEQESNIESHVFVKR